MLKLKFFSGVFQRFVLFYSSCSLSSYTLSLFWHQTFLKSISAVLLFRFDLLINITFLWQALTLEFTLKFNHNYGKNNITLLCPHTGACLINNSNMGNIFVTNLRLLLIALNIKSYLRHCKKERDHLLTGAVLWLQSIFHAYENVKMDEKRDLTY